MSADIQTFKTKKRKELEGRKEETGSNKTNLKAKYSPKALWVPNSSSDECNLGFLRGNEGCWEVFELEFRTG